MNGQYEQVVEMAVTEFDNVKIRITLTHPKFPHTLTSQMAFPRHWVDEMRYIKLPDDKDLFYNDMRIFEKQEFLNKHERAKNFVNQIAKNIANEILRTFGEKIKEVSK